MPNKFTYEQVKDIIESKGFILIGKEYVDIHTKIHTICPNGHDVYIRLASFIHSVKKYNGNGCKYCNYDVISKRQAFSLKDSHSKSLDEQEIKKVVEKYGFTFISYNSVKLKRNINNKNVLEVKCPYNHITLQSFNVFRKGKYRCSICSHIIANELATKRTRYSYEYVREYFSLYGCVLISNKYNNGNEKLEYVCNCGNKSKISFIVFKKGHRCQKCAGKKRAETRKLINSLPLPTSEFLNQIFQESHDGGSSQSD